MNDNSGWKNNDIALCIRTVHLPNIVGPEKGKMYSVEAYFENFYLNQRNQNAKVLLLKDGPMNYQFDDFGDICNSARIWNAKNFIKITPDEDETEEDREAIEALKRTVPIKVMTSVFNYGKFGWIN